MKLMRFEAFIAVKVKVKVKVNVKLSVCFITEHHTMKAC
jgi:hypothetical protein